VIDLKQIKFFLELFVNIMIHDKTFPKNVVYDKNAFRLRVTTGFRELPKRTKNVVYVENQTQRPNFSVFAGKFLQKKALIIRMRPERLERTQKIEYVRLNNVRLSEHMRVRSNKF